MDKAKQKRATHRRNVTKLLGKVDDLIANGVEEIDTIMLKHYMNETKEKRSDLKEFDNEILEILYEKAEDDVIDKEMDEASDYKEKITRALSLIEDALEKSKPKRQLSGSLESFASVSSTNSSAERGVKVNLPKLEPKKSGGKIHRRQEFWDGFCSAVHENEDLANVDKFKYLRSLLEEPAKVS